MMNLPNMRVAWIALAVVPVALLGLAAPASAHRLEKHFPVELRPLVTVRNFQGRIEVKSWNKMEVMVVAEHASDMAEVDADQVGNRIDIVTHLTSEQASAKDLEANYQITVPEETELQVRTDSGWVVVERVAGDMTIDTVTGNVDMKEVAGYLVIKTVGGSLVCYRCAGRIDFSSISGNVSFTQPVSNNVRAKTQTGRIFFDGEFLRGGTYNLNTYSGPIEVRFSDSDSFSLTATSRGEVQNEAKLRPPAHRRAVPGFANSIFGTFNDGLARVDLTSVSGTIRILRRGN